MVPQLYWELEHKAASDLVLMHWWNDHANGRHMYYGQALNNVMSHQDIADEGGDPTNPTQLDHKMRLQRAMDNVHGVTWWPGYTITSNFKGVLDSLSSKQTCRPALIPAYTWLDAEKPHRVNDLKIKKVSGKKCLVWQAHDTDDPMQQAVRYVIYRFPKGKKGSLDNADAILAITGETTFALPDGAGFPGKPYQLMPFFKELVEKYFRIYSVTGSEDGHQFPAFRQGAGTAKPGTHFASG